MTSQGGSPRSLLLALLVAAAAAPLAVAGCHDVAAFNAGASREASTVAPADGLVDGQA